MVLLMPKITTGRTRCARGTVNGEPAAATAKEMVMARPNSTLPKCRSRRIDTPRPDTEKAGTRAAAVLPTALVTAGQLVVGATCPRS
jgi:hypothetical protein